jgi:hypothetical protein
LLIRNRDCDLRRRHTRNHTKLKAEKLWIAPIPLFPNLQLPDCQ